MPKSTGTTAVASRHPNRFMVRSSAKVNHRHKCVVSQHDLSDHHFLESRKIINFISLHLTARLYVCNSSASTRVLNP
jgi:hypothetical protein